MKLLTFDSQHLDFVRESIGHQKIESTFSYAKELSNQERQKRTIYSIIIDYTKLYALNKAL